MYRMIKKRYPNTTVCYHATNILLYHSSYLICDISKRTPIYSHTGHKIMESDHYLMYISSNQYYNVLYTKKPEEKVFIHFCAPYWITDKDIQYVDYDLNIMYSNRSLIVDDIDAWRMGSSRYPELEVKAVLAAVSQVVTQLIQDRFAALDLLRDVYSRL